MNIDVQNWRRLVSVRYLLAINNICKSKKRVKIESSLGGRKIELAPTPTFRWIAKWLRRTRNLLCSGAEEAEFVGYGLAMSGCRRMVRELRAARCQNYESGLLENLHNYLECLTFNSAPASAASLLRTLALVLASRLLVL